MDGQNFENEQNTTVEAEQSNHYQDNTAIWVPPVYAEPAQQNQSNALAIVSLVMGILSIVFACCYGIGIVFGIAGIICAVVGKKNGTSGIRTAGLICSIIGTILSVLMILYVILVFAAVFTNPEMKDLIQSYENM